MAYWRWPGTLDTGAIENTRGLLEIAKGGRLLLEEISELHPGKSGKIDGRHPNYEVVVQERHPYNFLNHLRSPLETPRRSSLAGGAFIL